MVDENQCKGRHTTLSQILLYESGFRIAYFTSIFFYTFGIMLSQFAAVECKVLIQAGRGSLSRLCFLQHKGKLEQMLIPHLRNRGMDASFQRNDFWDADLAGRALLVIG